MCGWHMQELVTLACATRASYYLEARVMRLSAHVDLGSLGKNLRVFSPSCHLDSLTRVADNSGARS